jgi:hypothetical protein
VSKDTRNERKNRTKIGTGWCNTSKALELAMLDKRCNIGLGGVGQKKS